MNQRPDDTELPHQCCRCGKDFSMRESDKRIKLEDVLCQTCEQVAQEAFDILWELAKEAPLKIRCKMRRAARFAKDPSVNDHVSLAIADTKTQQSTLIQAALEQAALKEVDSRQPSTKREKIERILQPFLCWGRYTSADRHGWWLRIKLHGPGRWFYFLWPFKDCLKSEILPRKEKGFQ